MGSATGMNQLFRNLCHHTIWKYAILWKFQHENSMILTCEDSYAIDTKSGTAVEYAAYEEFVSCHPWGSNAQSGNFPSCSIIVAVSNMRRISYLLGEGIIGKVATMENHQWICVDDMNSDILLECPEELELQVAADIKTILLLPLLPLGLVQLGSLNKLSEDLAMVAQLKDLFCSYQYTSTPGLGMEQTDSSLTFDWPSLEKYSTSLEIITNLIDPIQSQPLTTLDFTTLSFDQMMVNELLPVGSVHFPQPVSQSYDPLTLDALHLLHGLDTDLFYEKSWSAMHSRLLRDHSEEQFMLNTSTFNKRTIESDQKTYLHENEVKTIPANRAHLTYLEEFDLIFESTTNNKYMDVSVEAGAHKAMEISCLMDSKNSEWMDDKSKTDEGSKLITFSKKERPGAFGFSDIEPCLIMNVDRTYYLPSISDGKEIESCDCANSHCSSTGRCAGFCLKCCKAEDVSNSEDSDLSSRNLSSLISGCEDFKSHPTTCQSRTSVHLAPKKLDEKGNAYGFQSSSLKESHNAYRRTNGKVPNKPRPRDRQLIQDRIRELRELIPNSSKCSVDALLQRAVDHMLFLQSVPVHANKLSQSTKPKVGDDDLNAHSTQVPQTAASWTFEVGNKSVTFPLIVENLDHPDQMLVEMQCRSHRLFLEIAQAIKRMGLAILKGILETRSGELWAHFIVEVPKGFHRVDIIWPLMQLLQLKF